MTVGHDIWDAVPPTGGAAVEKTALRNAVTARMPYVIADDDNPADLICVDPETGAAIVDIHYRGRLFHYDPTDGTTSGDGVTCIVSSEGRRYKLSDGADVFAYSVLDNSLTEPPDDQSLGDAYLVAAAATGDWVGKDGQVAVYTARGTIFVVFGIGRLLYVESLDAYVHRATSGEWVTGFGNLTIGPGSVPLSSAINFGRRVIVENQTTTSPPATASVGTAYIIGPSATGDWAGKDGKIAICEVVDTFTVYSPTIGWAAYDKSQNNEYRYDGSGWVSAVGAVLGYKDVYTAGNGSVTRDTGTGYNYATANFPTSAQDHWDDGINIAGYAARAVGNILVFEYSCLLTAGGSSQAITGGIIRGNEATALAFDRVDFATQTTLARFRFRVVASDTLPKDYRMGFWPNATPASALSSVEHRHFSVTEYLP